MGQLIDMQEWLRQRTCSWAIAARRVWDRAFGNLDAETQTTAYARWGKAWFDDVVHAFDGVKLVNWKFTKEQILRVLFDQFTGPDAPWAMIRREECAKYPNEAEFIAARIVALNHCSIGSTEWFGCLSRLVRLTYDVRKQIDASLPIEMLHVFDRIPMFVVVQKDPSSSDDQPPFVSQAIH